MAVLGGMLGILAAVAVIVMTFVFIYKPTMAAPLLVLVGMVLARPNIWGEQYSMVSIGFFGLAAGIALVQDKGGFLFDRREFRGVRSPLLWVSAAYIWLLLRVSSQGLDSTSQTVNGLVAAAACLVSVVFVVGEKKRRDYLIKGFIFAVLLVSSSYVVTAAFWAAFGVGSGVVGHMFIGNWPAPQPVYFPFTTTVASQPVLGMILPRFVGFAREPGWMAMYSAVAFFLMPLAGWHRKFFKLVVLVGLLGTLSTAGFGILVVCLALRFTFSRKSKSDIGAVLRLAFGVGFVVFAIWAAFNAPILGFDAKGAQNGISLSERTAATNMGVWAFQHDPFSGGLAADKVGAVNLVAAVAAYGLPFSVAMGLATTAPILRHKNRRVLIPIVTVVFLTLLMSQPSLDSSWAFALVIIAAAAAIDPAAPPMKKAPPKAKTGQLPSHYQHPAAEKALKASALSD